jgi:hypothetical protein
MHHKLTVSLNLNCNKKTCGNCEYLRGSCTECSLFLDNEFFSILNHDNKRNPLRLKRCLDSEKIEKAWNV